MAKTRLSLTYGLIGVACSTLLILSGCSITPPDQKMANTIIYSCENEIGMQLCLIKTDGTGFRQLTSRNVADRRPINDKEVFLTGYVNPIMNGRGNIMALCYDAVPGSDPPLIPEGASEETVKKLTDFYRYAFPIYSVGICAINPKTGKETVLERSRVQSLASRAPRFDMNAHGIYWHDCSGLCRASVSGRKSESFWQVLEDYSTLFVVNSSTQIVFGCRYRKREQATTPPKNTAVMELCLTDQSNPNDPLVGLRNLIDPEKSKPSQITSLEMQSWPMAVNDKGLILFLCDQDVDDKTDYGICQINSDGAGFVRGKRIFAQDDWDINNDGTVVSSCYDGNDLEICVYHDDLTQPIYLTDNDTHDEYPVINDNGVIAYICDNKDLCVINSDGSGQKVLSVDPVSKPDKYRGSDIESRRPHLDIQ